MSDTPSSSLLAQPWPQPAHRGSILIDAAPCSDTSALDTILWACAPLTPSSFVLPPPSYQRSNSLPDHEIHRRFSNYQRFLSTPTPSVTTPDTPIIMGAAICDDSLVRKMRKPLPPRIDTSLLTVSSTPPLSIDVATPLSATLTASAHSETDQIALDSVLASTQPDLSLPEMPENGFYAHIPLTSTLPPPRPPNAFILYRRHQSSHLRRQHPGLHLRVVSRVVSKWWRDCTEAERKRWRGHAERAKAEHQSRWPDYRYKPKNDDTTGGSTPGGTTPAKLNKKARGGKRDSLVTPTMVLPPPLPLTFGEEDGGWVQMLDELGYDDHTGASNSSNSAPPPLPLFSPTATHAFPQLWWPAEPFETDMMPKPPALEDMTGMSWTLTNSAPF